MARQWTAAQSAAMNTNSAPVLVSASAGSGKTATLTERIIRKLTDREHPAELSRLLIVTFTRAAAAELKVKISNALSATMMQNPSDKHIQKQLLSLSNAHICTIDSFCMEAVKSSFSVLGLPAGFRIADNAELLPLSDRVLDELLESFYIKYADSSKQNGSVFSLLDNNEFADLCDAFSSDRNDDTLKKTVRSLYDKLLTYPIGLERLKQQAERLQEQANGDILQSDFGKALWNWKQLFALSMKQFYDEALAVIAADADAAPMKKAFTSESDFADRFLAASTYADIRQALEERKSGTVRAKNLPDYLQQLNAKRKMYTDSCKDLFTAKLFSYDEDCIRADMRKTARMCEILYDFLTAYDMRMTAEKKQRGVCDFTDNRRNLLSLLLTKDGSPSPLCGEMQERFDEVYIDEYQDVDEVQDTIFSLVGGTHRFMVGDIKQSIYSFRGADSGVFAGYRKRLPLLNPAQPDTTVSADGNCIFMSVNFRCDEPVIRYTNALCGYLFRACPDTIGYGTEDDLVFSKLMPAGAVPHKVQIDLLSDSEEDGSDSPKSDGDEDLKDAELEAIHVANIIADLLRRKETLDDGSPIRPEDISVLVRTNTNIPLFISALNRVRIRANNAELDAVSSGQNLMDSPDMTYLINLLRVFDNPDTDAPLAEVLRAPFPALSLEDLITVRSCGNGSLYDGLNACAAGVGAGEDLSARASVFISWLEHYRTKCMELSADRILRMMRTDERVAGRRSPAFLYLYDTARTVKTGSFTGVYDFLRYFEKKMEDASHAFNQGKQRREGSVSVMTIHASKGLEAPVVILANSGRSFDSGSHASDISFDKDTGLAMKLFNRTTGTKYTPSLYQFSRVFGAVKDHEDEIRILYVALTRAQERLYITGVTKDKYPIQFAPTDRFVALTRGSYLEWITSVWASSPASADWADIHTIPLSSIEMSQPLTDTERNPLSAAEEQTAAYYRALNASVPALSETDALLRSIPTKVPASRMQTNLLDRCVFLSSDLPVGDENKLSSSEQGFGICDPQSVTAVEQSILLMKSSKRNEFDVLLEENQKPTAAEMGSAVHAFLQYCSISTLKPDDIETEIKRLTEEQYLDARTARIADRMMLKNFFDSQFCGLVKNAAVIQREFRFARFVPLRDLTANPALVTAVGNRKLYVQGSVDLLLTMPNGELILCDYKTDHITREERDDVALLTAHMTEKHGAQLEQYAAAIREIFGKQPAHMYIFSLALGEAVEIQPTRV